MGVTIGAPNAMSRVRRGAAWSVVAHLAGAIIASSPALMRRQDASTRGTRAGTWYARRVRKVRLLSGTWRRLWRLAAPRAAARAKLKAASTNNPG